MIVVRHQHHKMSITDFKEIERTLNMIMRYVLAGGAFALAFGVIRPSHFRFLCTDSAHCTVSVSLTVLFVLVSGVTIYLLHRALAFPVIRHCLMLCLIKKRDYSFTPKSPKSLEAALTRKRHALPKDDVSRQHFAT